MIFLLLNDHLFRTYLLFRTMVLKEINLCIAIVISTLAIQHLATRELTRDIVAKLCPYNDFCHVKASRVLGDGKVPCCIECSCQDDCWRTSSCCSDMEHKTNKTHDLTCANTMVRQDPAVISVAVYDGLNRGNRYFIHDKCPKHAKDEELKKARFYLGV